jgi:hypothetical protein
MPLLEILLVIIVVGFLLWLVDTYIPMRASIKRILEAVVIIVLVLWLLQVFGFLPVLTSARIGR